jgi:hypothetical protein
LPEQPDYQKLFEVTKIDELQYIGKKNQIWLCNNAVNKGFAVILVYVIGDGSAATFKPLWKIIKGW